MTILFCFGVVVVYLTPKKLQKSYLQILSTPLKNWIFLSGSRHHFSDPVVFYLLQLQCLQLYTIFTKILCLVTKYTIIQLIGKRYFD